MLLYCIEGIAVNTVGARWLGIITIDVLRKDVPDEVVCPSHRCSIGQTDHVLVKSVLKGAVRMFMNRFHGAFPTCKTRFCAGPVRNFKDAIQLVTKTNVV